MHVLAMGVLWGAAAAIGLACGAAPSPPASTRAASDYDLMTTAVALEVPAESTRALTQQWTREAAALVDALSVRPLDSTVHARAWAHVADVSTDRRPVARAVAAAYLLEHARLRGDVARAGGRADVARALAALDSSRFTSPYLVAQALPGVALRLPEPQRRRLARNAAHALRVERPVRGSRPDRFRDSLLQALEGVR